MINRKMRGRREGGQTLIVAALVMAVVIGFTAMAIDVGLFLEDRRQLQNAADAAALAGVQHLPQQPDVARARARAWANDNGVPNSQIVAIEIQTTNYANDTVSVEVTREFGWIFGRVLGKTTSKVPARAKAVVGSLGGNTQMMPWALLEGDTDCLYPDGSPMFGETCVVKVGAGSSAIMGWYGALDYDGTGGGGAEYEANIIDGTTNWHYCIAGDSSPGCVSAVSVVDALSGNKVGGTDHGIDDRLAEMGTPCDTNGNDRDDFDEVFEPNPNPGATYVVACPQSPRVVIIPIVSYATTPVHTVTIRGWSLAYLDTYWCSKESVARVAPAGYVFAAPIDGSMPIGAPIPPAAPSTPAPTPVATPVPTPGPTAVATATPAPGPGGGGCNGTGHWEVQIRLVDAVYSQATGFMTGYDPNVAITVRRLVE